MSAPPNDLILYHYPFSPYAKRVTNYLAIRGIEYAQCLQAPTHPRPDLNALGIQYRRIPLMSHGRHVYADTRLILRHLENTFPQDNLTSTDPTHRGIERLLERYITDAGIFNRAAQLIPAEMPLLKDSKFTKDREQLSGRTWSPEAQAKGRPEALSQIRDLFELMENTFLADGREWVLGTKGPMMADIESAWVFEWLMGMKTLPDYLGEKAYPKIFAWVRRYQALVKEMAKKPATLKGPQAAEHILGSGRGSQEFRIDAQDPLGLREGDTVTVFPMDSGFRNKDTGTLVGLTPEEVIVEISSPQGGKTVFLHAPRWGFRVEKGGGSSKI